MRIYFGVGFLNLVIELKLRKICYKRDFYRKIGGVLSIYKHEMQRILNDMEARKLIRHYKSAPDWRTTKYVLYDSKDVVRYEPKNNIKDYRFKTSQASQ
jgi:hypothetical protein